MKMTTRTSCQEGPGSKRRKGWNVAFHVQCERYLDSSSIYMYAESALLMHKYKQTGCWKMTRIRFFVNGIIYLIGRDNTSTKIFPIFLERQHFSKNSFSNNSVASRSAFFTFSCGLHFPEIFSLAPPSSISNVFVTQ